MANEKSLKSTISKPKSGKESPAYFEATKADSGWQPAVPGEGPGAYLEVSGEPYDERAERLKARMK